MLRGRAGGFARERTHTWLSCCPGLASQLHICARVKRRETCEGYVHRRAGHQPPAPRVELDEQWDAALEYSIRSVIYSTIGGCVAAYSLFRES